METKVLSTEEAEPPGTRTAVREAGDVAGMRTAIPPFAPYPRIIKRQVNQVPRFPVSERSEAFRARFYSETTAAEWCDWRWQLRHRIRSLEELERIVRLTTDERTAIARHRGSLPVSITPYYASLIDPHEASHPLRRTMIPVTDEYLGSPGEA